MFKHFFTLLLFVILTGCYSIPMPEKGELYTSISDVKFEDKALVHIYRNSTVLGQGGLTQVLFDNKEVIRLDDEGYSTLYVSKGCYVLSHVYGGQNPGSVITFPSNHCFEPGQTYFLRILPNSGSYSAAATGQPGMIFESGSLHSKIVQVTEETAFSKYSIDECYEYRPLLENISKESLKHLPSGAGKPIDCDPICFSSYKLKADGSIE